MRPKVLAVIRARFSRSRTTPSGARDVGRTVAWESAWISGRGGFRSRCRSSSQRNPVPQRNELMSGWPLSSILVVCDVPLRPEQHGHRVGLIRRRLWDDFSRRSQREMRRRVEVDKMRREAAVPIVGAARDAPPRGADALDVSLPRMTASGLHCERP